MYERPTMAWFRTRDQNRPRHRSESIPNHDRFRTMTIRVPKKRLLELFFDAKILVVVRATNILTSYTS